MNLSDPNTMTILAAIGGVILFVLQGGRGDSGERKRHAIELAGFLKAEGFNQLADVLTSYATGSAKSLLAVLKGCKESFRDPARRAVELDQVFEKQLAKRLADPIQCKRIAEQVNAAQASVAP